MDWEYEYSPGLTSEQVIYIEALRLVFGQLPKNNLPASLDDDLRIILRVVDRVATRIRAAESWTR